MIQKLYDLKKSQTDQKLVEKGQVVSKIDKIEAEILITQTQINTTGVQPHGAISDFTILQMHKNSMKLHISKLKNEKAVLESQLEILVNQVIELQKESEQFDYMLQEEKREAIKKLLLAEEEASSEYMQSKYISR